MNQSEKVAFIIVVGVSNKNEIVLLDGMGFFAPQELKNLICFDLIAIF